MFPFQSEGKEYPLEGAIIVHFHVFRQYDASYYIQWLLTFYFMYFIYIRICGIYYVLNPLQ